MTPEAAKERRAQSVRTLLQEAQKLSQASSPKGQRKPIAKMTKRQVRNLAGRPANPLPYLRFMVELRRALLRELKRHVLNHMEAIAPTLRQDAADEFSQRFANFEVSVGRLTDQAALENRLKAIANGVQEHSRGELARIHSSPFTPQMESKSRAFVQENVRLIKKMTREQVTAIRDIVVVAVQQQTTYREVKADIEEQFGLTKSRAELIARDQILKHNAEVTEELHKQAGVTKYIWNTSHDERVRGTPGGKWPKGNHYFLDGKIFEYSNPPVVDTKTGRKANPGQDYQCRCIAIPYTDDLLYAED